ncbi:sarcoplasmic calcium-binding protein-like, partial [Lingula anatina]|uniref:Sarcoplasmic calcium-binding protein-like n=1 Tax=Lingula anatina TaxID=7574 RepID=A0A1S3ISG8_LINAN
DELDIGDEWRAKIVRFFSKLDADKDGIVDRRDYVDKTVERARRYFGADKINDFNDTISEAWLSFWSVSEDEYKGSLDEKDAIWIHKRLFKVNKLDESNRDWAEGLFRAADGDDNEELSVYEHKTFCRVFNVQEGFDKSFKCIDGNQNGIIDKEEFLQAAHDYFYNRKVDSWFFGV